MLPTPKPRHTPGPWFASCGGFLVTDRAADADGALIVADLQPINEYGDELPTVNTDDGVREANARLIAAAPVMLVALKAAAIALTMVRGPGDPATLNSVRAAIAKAEGRKKDDHAQSV